MKYTSEQYFRMWLAGIENIGSVTYAKLLERYGSAEAVWRGFDASFEWIGEKAYVAIRDARDRDKALRQAELLEKIGARAVFADEAAYPALLRAIEPHPPILYVLGNCDISRELAVGVVGTRKPSEYGAVAAREISAGLARLGFAVVSGFALGIDSAAHDGAINAGGHTVAVFACGVDYCYPPQNKDFLKRLLDSGGSVISEYPPGVRPLPGRFPARNRIISGMSRGVLVCEGLWKSGARVTADIAAEQGREVFVLPGSIFEPRSELTSGLARDGARLITSALDIARDLGYETSSSAEPPRVSVSSYKPKQKNQTKAEALMPAKVSDVSSLDDMEREVLKLYQSGTSDVDEIVKILGLSAADANSVLTTLQLEGII